MQALPEDIALLDLKTGNTIYKYGLLISGRGDSVPAQRDIIGDYTRYAFIQAAARAAMGDLEKQRWKLDAEMRSCGIGSSNKRTGAGKRDVASRMEDYFDTINWADRNDVRRIVPFFERLIRLMAKVPESGHYSLWIRLGLEEDGWRINWQGKIVTWQ